MNAKLKTARRDKGLTQVQLSHKLQELGRKGAPQQISNWEKGHYFPSHRNLSAICQILEVNLVEHSIVQNLKSGGNAGDTTEKLANEVSMVEKLRKHCKTEFRGKLANILEIYFGPSFARRRIPLVEVVSRFSSKSERFYASF